MERELWPVLFSYLRRTAEEVRQKYVQLQPWVVVATLLWAALHDRPVSWACNPLNWSTRLKPLQIPSAPTMSRRAGQVGTGLFWRQLEQHLRQSGHPGLIAFIDGKPLPVGGASKDPDAHAGRAVGGMAKGYKLHAVWSAGVLPESWETTPMNVSEKTVARRLIPQLQGGGYLLADGDYDASPLYDLAFAYGYQLIAPHRKAKNPGSGGHYQSPHRLRSIQLLHRDEWLHHEYGQQLYKARKQIERDFGNATAFGGGLAPLPAWVRGQQRVRTWVWAKLLINAVRILSHKDLHHP
jgi:hypothetical protein